MYPRALGLMGSVKAKQMEFLMNIHKEK